MAVDDMALNENVDGSDEDEDVVEERRKVCDIVAGNRPDSEVSS